MNPAQHLQWTVKNSTELKVIIFKNQYYVTDLAIGTLNVHVIQLGDLIVVSFHNEIQPNLWWEQVRDSLPKIAKPPPMYGTLFILRANGFPLKCTSKVLQREIKNFYEEKQKTNLSNYKFCLK